MQETTGNTQTHDDTLDPARSAAMHATFGLSGNAPTNGDPLPPFWHKIYFWDVLPAALLGQDGHPKTGTGLIPDLGLPQRMWAGGRLTFQKPVLIGQHAKKSTVVENIVQKNGRSGPLAFVTLRHEVSQSHQICITEHQDIVYRTAPQTRPVIAPPMARTDETLSEPVAFSPTLLFRYSALTFNGHRIHYDLEYSKGKEGYRGLVVHGPMLAQLLAHMATRQIGPLKSFSFRATSALMHDETADLCWCDGTLWVRGPDGRLCMEATAT